jgi:hypothetical protein
VLKGTSSYDGAIDLSYAQDAAIQGKKVGAAVVLLEVDFGTNQHFLDASDGLNEYVSELPTFGGATGTVFASYWAKANAP